jgi:hypothetical protein
MPCYATGSAAGDAALSEREAREEATRLARLLCLACESSERRNHPLPALVAQWWREHKKIDAERRARELERDRQEQLVASAKSKLTSAERAALGLTK